MRALLLALLLATLPATEQPWACFAWLPYDNNLEQAGLAVDGALVAGAMDHAVPLVSLLDDRRPDGLRRTSVAPEGSSIERLGSDDSTDAALLAAELAAARRRHPGRRWLVVLGGHGGDLGEASLDARSGREDGRRWMPMAELGAALRSTAGGSEIDLLVLQQCGRASLGDLWQLRDCASTVLASSETIGSPNTWYAPVFRHLAINMAVESRDLAALVARHDRHYLSLACIDGRLLGELPVRLAELEGGAPSTVGVPTIYEASARAVAIDALAWLVDRPCATWLRGELLLQVWHRHEGLRRPVSGLSVFVGSDGGVRDLALWRR